ncbi:T9SS type A sorting domain-containing protein [candidate division KSB1 bacterium]|nr:T9SS type A sorting domain-containing protein [candidate division KSB1 bacterium]
MHMKQFFSVCFSVFLFTQINSQEAFSQHFTFVQSDDVYSTVIHLVGVSVSDQDEIGVFCSDDNGAPICAGATVLSAEQTNVSLATWKDDPQTQEKDGFVTGEMMQFRFWDASEQHEFNTIPEYLRGNGEWNNGLWAELNLTLSTTVPVELSSFAAQMVNDNIVVEWRTETEKNAYGFDIERCTDYTQFQKVGFLKAAGTTIAPQHYEFVDQNITPGTYHYRLRQIDLDGTAEYSNTIQIECGKPISYHLYSNYPNPFNPSTYITFDLPEYGAVTLQIFNLHGQLVETLIKQELNSGTHRIEWNASQFPSGVYIARLISGRQARTIKLMLMK